MNNKIPVFFSGIFFTLTLFTVGCSAQSEEAALQSLRQMTKDGKLPSEEFVAGIERRFAGKKTGALAKLLRARIRFENKDFAGAAAILNSSDFQQKTAVGDHAMWLRGRALHNAGNHPEAMNTLKELIQTFPDSLRVRDAKLLWAASATASGQASKVPDYLRELTEVDAPDALLLTAKAYEAQNIRTEMVNYYRKVYFYGAGSDAAKEAEAKLTSLGQPLTPQTAEEIKTRAEKLYAAKNYVEAERAFSDLTSRFAAAVTPQIHLKRLVTFVNLKKMPEAQTAFIAISPTATEKEEAYFQLAMGNAKARQWLQARQTVEEMRQKYPTGSLVPRTLIDVGLAAREAKNRLEEGYFLKTAVHSYPNTVEVAQAQFEFAWYEHENRNFAQSSQMFTEHLARYVDKDTTNRGKAGYWAARDSERAGKIAEACALYDGVLYRYSANWYGYLALQRITAMKRTGKCGSPQNFLAGSLVQRAVSNLKTVTVAAETSTPKELVRAEKSEELSTIGLFDWAIDELEEAKKTAQNSPKINMALARHYRMKGSNVQALLALAKSYPDYSQMFPEEMGREEWEIFYPLTNWDQIKAWAKHRNLDQYQVAGLIRQESVFEVRAKSHANAYGLMQLILPTARAVARKYGSTANLASAESLYQPALNIELGTAYMRDQFDKFGRIEYVAVAYNAGPNRVNPWRATLPAEIDEFVEAIPFKETKGYVQGVIRNSAQYRRLYDDNGNFKPTVGARPLRGEIDSKSREQFAQEFPEIVLDENLSE